MQAQEGNLSAPWTLPAVLASRWTTDPSGATPVGPDSDAVMQVRELTRSG